MTPVKSWVIIGPGGSRIDFIAGWLSTIDHFVNTNWSLDINTGSSSGESRITKWLDFNPSMQLKDTLNEHNLTPQADAELTIATTCHGVNLATQTVGIDKDALKVIFVDISSANINRVHWEFVVKTYLTQIKDLHSLKNNTLYPTVDKLLGNNEPLDLNRIAVIEKILRRQPKLPSRLSSIANVVLEYNKVFHPLGIEYLEQKLGISASPRHRETWPQLIQIATSPDEIYRFGKLWRFLDYF